METLDTIEKLTPDNKRAPFKKWAFKFLIYIVLLNVILVFKLWNHSGYGSSDRIVFLFNTVGLIIDVLSLVGIVLILISIVKKENQDYKYWLNVLGYSFIIISLILINFI